MPPKIADVYFKVCSYSLVDAKHAGKKYYWIIPSGTEHVGALKIRMW